MYRSVDVEFFERSLAEFVRAGSFDDAVQLVETSWPAIAATDGRRLRASIESIPEHAWHDNPWLLAAMGSSYRSLDSTSRSAALPWFRSSEALARAQPVGHEILAGILAHHSAALRSLGRLDAALELARRAWDLLGDDIELSPSVRVRAQAHAALQLGLALMHTGDTAGADTMLRTALGLSERTLTRAEVVETRAGLAFVGYLCGEIETARAHIRRTNDASGSTGLIESRFGVGAIIADALIASESRDLARATTLCAIAGTTAGRTEWQPFAHLAIAAVSVINGHHIEGLDEVRVALDSTRTWRGHSLARVMCAMLRGELLMHLGEFAAAISAFDTVVPTTDHSICPARFIAGIRYKAGDSTGCLAALAGCDFIGEAHSPRTIVDLLVLTAAASYQLDRAPSADVTFDRALLLAATSGVRAPFTLVSTVVLQHMVARASDRHQAPLVHELLLELRTSQDQPLTGTLEPLSEREVDIALHLFEDKTVSQIARELYISTNTVKTHVRSIYRKLSANNRQDAVRRVRELGLEPKITPQ